MKNMFSGNREKQIPKDLKDCYKTDSTTQNLWIWCERLETCGKILFWILIIGGLIFSISTSIVEKEVIVEEATFWREAETELRETFDFEIFIPLLFETALYSFIEYCAYHVLALLISSLASIVQHTKITANIALYNSAKSESITDDTENIRNHAPTPSDPKTDYSKKLSDITVDNSSNYWKCCFCGSNNPQGTLSCKTCGNYK